MKWLIDGHNLIGQMPDLRLDDPHDEEKLLEHLRRYRARTGDQLTVVFDPGGGYRTTKTRKQGGITVQFAPTGRTADQILIRRLRRVKNRQGVKVVSSDRSVQQAARQAGVQVVKSQQFAAQLVSDPTGSLLEISLGSQADVQLSPEEVDEWLSLFNQDE